MRIVYRCIVVRESLDPKVNSEFPVGTELDIPAFWYNMGYYPSMDGTSTGLDLTNVARLSKQRVII